jgi:hypothetical protein
MYLFQTNLNSSLNPWSPATNTAFYWSPLHQNDSQMTLMSAVTTSCLTFLPEPHSSGSSSSSPLSTGHPITLFSHGFHDTTLLFFFLSYWLFFLSLVASSFFLYLLEISVLGLYLSRKLILCHGFKCHLLTNSLPICISNLDLSTLLQKLVPNCLLDITKRHFKLKD